MKTRNRAFQRQRDGWKQSPDRRNFTPSHNAVSFTLVDEARQTSSHDSSFWSQSTQLRKKPVAFVSSGSHDPLTSPQIETEDAEASNNTTEVSVEVPAEVPVEATSEQRLLEDVSSSDEVIVFKGRNPTKRKTQVPETAQVPEITVASETTQAPDITQALEATQTSEITLTSIQTEIRAVEKQLSVESREPHTRYTEAEAKEGGGEDKEHYNGLLWSKKKSDKSRRRQLWREDSDDEAILADYIANMRQNGEMMDEISDDDDSESTASDDAGDDPSTSLDPKTAEDVDIYSEAGYKPRGSLFDEPDNDLDKRESQPIPQSLSRERLKDKSLLEDATNATYMNSFTELEYLEEQTGFDLMDWERPSLRRKKGKAGRLHLTSEDIDSDLEERLQAAYSNDRQKKAQRKKEREELRATGMLGKRSQPDLQAKYRTGITMSQVADEVKTFLTGSQEMRVDSTANG
ncbi:hypothetical protein ACHAQJ_009087 [Trichoderma viride]